MRFEFEQNLLRPCCGGELQDRINDVFQLWAQLIVGDERWCNGCGFSMLLSY